MNTFVKKSLRQKARTFQCIKIFSTYLNVLDYRDLVTLIKLLEITDVYTAIIVLQCVCNFLGQAESCYNFLWEILKWDKLVSYFTVLYRLYCINAVTLMKSFVWGSVNHKMAVPVPSISCCVFKNNDFFTKSQMS